ncbi:MAG TPA: DUF1028 domain-containing protein [Gaiellaceae bacterium]|nr:DUF1028 domain-containing protein [Gaiellaceae bacterium]
MTYSIVARDPETGELGVAVQSQSFNTGAAVPWARPGVGAIATQSFTDKRYGWRGLELLADGASPDDALRQLLDEDELPGFRQVGFLAADGRVAQWTGERCIDAAGHVHGESWAAQANLVESPAVWEDMGAAFEAASGSLAQRLLAALDAAQAAGGDWRGRGGAGIVVVPAEGQPWDRVIDLRVEEGDDSLERLRALVDRAEGYRSYFRSEDGKSELAERAGLSGQQQLWGPVLDALAADDVESARARYAAMLTVDPRWAAYARTFDAHPQLPSLTPLLGD